MQHILDAIQAVDAAPGDFAALQLPESYRAVTVHKDEVDIFEGQVTREKDPRQSLHVGDPERELLEPGAGVLEEPRDRRRGVQGGEELETGALARSDAHHRLPHPLVGVGLLVEHGHAEGVTVEGDRLVEVRHRDADVVDRGEQVRLVARCGHGAIVVRGVGGAPGV